MSCAVPAIHRARALMATPGLARFHPTERLTGPHIVTMADMITADMTTATGQIATTIFHAVGTARMGPAIGTPLTLVGKTQIFPNY